MEWQPIETAPKDGTRIIGFDPVQWEGERISTTYKASTGEWVFEAELESRGWDDYGHGRWNPTHWMPRPPEPIS